MSHATNLMDERRELFLSVQKAETERDEALAQVAVLVAEAGAWAHLIPGMHHADLTIRTGGRDIHFEVDALIRTLSNLPAAAKEMVAEQEKTKRLLEIARNNVENLSRFLYPKASMRLVEIAEDDALQAENARLREALDNLQFGEGDERCWCVAYKPNHHVHNPRCQKAQASLSSDKSD